MRKKFRIATLLSLLLISMIAVTACGKTDKAVESTSPATTAPEATAAAPTETPKKEQATVVYALPQSQTNYGGIKDLIAKWEAKTGNKVDLQAIPDDQYINLIKTKFAAGEGYDIFKQAGAQFNVVDPEKYFLEMTDTSYESRTIDAVHAAFVYNGKHYGIPSADGLATWGVFYNKKVFADLGLSVPTTYADFEKVADAIKAKGITPVFWAVKDGWTALQHINASWGSVKQTDPDIEAKLNKNEMKFSDVKSIAADAQKISDWAKKGYFNKDLLTATYEMQVAALTSGTAAMAFQGNWFEGEMAKKDPNAQIGFFPYPSETGESLVPVNLGSMHVISKTAKYPEATIDFAKFLIEPENVKSYLAITPGISLFKDANADDSLLPATKESAGIVGSGLGGVQFANSPVYNVPYNYDGLIANYAELLAGRISGPEYMKKMDDIFIANGKLAKMPGF